MSHFKGEVKRSMQTVQTVLKFPIKSMPERGIKVETCEHYGVRSEFSEVEGCVIAHYFPVTKKGKVVGFLKRDLTQPKKSAFSTVGDVDTSCDLVGQDVCQKGKKLFIAEGQYDYLSVWQSLFFSSYNQGLNTPFIPNVVTIGLGTKHAAEHISNNQEFVNTFQEPITVFDNDEATPEERLKGIVKGRDAVMEVALCIDNMKNVQLDLNDPNEYIKDGKSEDLSKLLMFGATVFQVDSVEYGGGVYEELIQKIPKGVMIPGLPVFMSRLRGLRPRELTIILAPPKAGKTTLCKLINYHLLLMKKKTLGIYLEEDIVKTRQSFIALDNNVHLPLYREDPDIVPDEQRRRTLKEVLDPQYARFTVDKKGHIGPERLMQILEWEAARGVEFVILDHLSFVFSGSTGANERKEIDNLLTNIAAFVKKTGIHVIAVAHITRDKNRGKPKNQDGTINYPYWYEIEPDDGRGSGAFEQVTSNLIGIDKEIKEDKTRGFSRISILYAREWDNSGVCDTLTLDAHTGRMKAITEEYLSDE
jgi:archaellum biogenesis ATPase FlaH